MLCGFGILREGKDSGENVAMSITNHGEDKRAQHQRTLLHGAPQPPARQPKPGDVIWRLRDNETGRVQSCELRNNAAVGAGWEVMLLDEDGELRIRRTPR